MHENTKNDLCWAASFLLVGFMWLAPFFFMLWGWA